MSPFSSSPSSMRDNGAISGTVQDIHNNPLKDVLVELTNATGVVINSTYTSVSGYFEFSRVAQGSYVIVATAGLQQSSEHVESNGFSNTVALRLQTTDKPEDGVNGSAISVAQYKVPGKARDEYRKARNAAEKGKDEEAHKHLAKALEIYPNYADALTLQGVLELNQHNADAAIADLDKAIKADGNFAMAYMVMGSALNMQGKFDEALRALEHGESLAPDYWQAHFEMGKAYIGKSDYQAALGHLQRAQSMAPKEYALIYLLQAHALLAMKQYSEAMSALQTYLQKEPTGPNRQEAEKLLEKTQAFVGAGSH
jgi:tetratricopeptide (TPR) repeat protein